MNLVNPYNKNSTFTHFQDLDEKISKYYDIVNDDVSEINPVYKLVSPRYRYESGLKVGFRDIFYYIDLLYHNDPKTIVDVGCGECIFKNWFPNIIGFDPEPSTFSKADFVDYFDKDFVDGHKDFYDGAMALNSIHFIPWSKLQEQINLAMGIIKPGSRFLFTFNFYVLDNYSEAECVVAKGSMDDKFEYFSNMLENVNYKKIVVDSPMHKGMSYYDLENYMAFLNGTVRIILEK
jgi:hypothetical protein